MWNILLSIFFIGNLQGVVVEHTLNLHESHADVRVMFNLGAQEVLYRDSLKLSSDHPDMAFSAWQIQQESVPFFNKITHETISVFQQNPEISFSVYWQKDISYENPRIYVSYQTNTMKTAEFYAIKLPFKRVASDTKTVLQEKQLVSDIPNGEKKMARRKYSFSTTLFCYYQKLEDFLKQSSSLSLQLILSFLIGLLLSLTPCIYPMIPITVGILQSQQHKSFFSNFLRALFYTLGLSTTFALLGLLASYTGPLYGQLLAHPIFVIILVTFLCYLALTMLGIFDLYIPRFLNGSWQNSQRGSLISAFLLGAASGTFASPCVSPGLILLLSIVATLNNIFLGFLLLFCFGVGLSTPLLIVGTFSAALNLLPRAGIWMIEIKKIFGLMLIGAAVYYLSAVVNFCILLSILAVVLAILGLWYAHHARHATTGGLKKYHWWMAMILCCAAGFLAVQTYWQIFCPDINIASKNIWHTDFQATFEKARKLGKPVFIDVYADYCSICKLIEKNVLLKSEVVATLDTCTVPLKINASDTSNPSYNQISQYYKILGYPTFLLVDATTYAVIKEWHSELYSTPIKDFTDTLERAFCK